MNEQRYDALVVGSGCAGAWVAKELTEAGFDTLVLEAGPPRAPGDVPPRYPELLVPVADDPGTDGPDLDGPPLDGPPLDGAVPGRGAGSDPPARQHVQRQHSGFRPRGPHLFVDDDEHPYRTPPDRPYVWIRGMQVGGRSLVWGGTSLRFSPSEMDAPPVDGCMLAWPLRYEDLAPWYTVVEELIGVSGNADGLPQLPDSAYTRGPYPFTPAEEQFRLAYHGRQTRPVSVRFVPAEDGADGWPRFTMQGTALAAAARTGHLTLRPDAVVTQVRVDARTGLATGVRYVDRTHGTAHEARARVVVLCAGTIETARLMLNSRGPRHPEGLGNSTGWVGRGLMDHPVVVAAGELPDHQPVDGYEWSARQRGLMIPPPVSPADPAPVRPFGMWVGLQRLVFDGRPWGTVVAQGEMLPYRHNRVRLGTERDRWGVPIPVIDCAYGPHEDRLYRAMRREIDRVAALAGVKVLVVDEKLTVPGLNVHDLGTARMGTGPDSSVLDADNRCWDCPNVYVTDGACFPSGGWQNPSLTIMAISARAGRHAAALLGEGRY